MASVRSRIDAAVAVFAGICSVLLAFLPAGWNVTLSALFACSLGGILERWMS